MASTKRNQPSVGPIAKGEVIKDQGTVSYNGPKNVATPNTLTGIVTKGTNKGMGEALRGGSFTYD
jgi:hypothetical protein|tara:strand:- start:188 stop:382 length:195 start_codon:yes stop_codon:yes gene_type:complete